MQRLRISFVGLGLSTLLLASAFAQGGSSTQILSQWQARQSSAQESLLRGSHLAPQVRIIDWPDSIREIGEDCSVVVGLDRAYPVPIEVGLVLGGDALRSVDYTLSQESLIFAPGETERIVSVSALADGELDGGDTITVSAAVQGAPRSSSPKVSIDIEDPSTLVSGTAGAFSSDDFAGCGGLGNLWAVLDPLGDADIDVSTQGADSVLGFSVPGGVEHQAYHALFAPHVMQPLASGDFEVEIKFTDRPDDEEIYGILIKQDDQNWLRFDFYGYAGSTYVYTGRTRNGFTSNRGNWSVAGSGGSLWMRVTRVGNNWTLRTSTDGVSYVFRRTYGNTFAPTEIGPYLGNFGSFPAADMSVDYMFDAAAPITPEDGSGGANQDLNLTVAGSGSVSTNPGGTDFPCGTPVTLTANPASGWAFDSWSGDVSGTNPVAQVVMNGPVNATATFVVDNGPPPVISGIQINAQETQATVSWQTDLLADSQVDYGLTAALGTTIFNPSFVTGHALQMTSLLPGNTYFLQITSRTQVGALGQAGNLTLTTPGGGGPRINGDDFNDCGGPSGLWTVEDPSGTSAVTTLGMGTNNATLRFSAPQGASYEAFGTLDVPYVWQPMTDGNFEIVAKMQALPTANRSTGILFLETNNDWLSFEVYRQGTNLRTTGVSTVGGVSTRVFDIPLTLSGTAWIGARRTGNVWDLITSDNGTNYTVVRTVTNSLDQERFGLYAGNLGTLPSVNARFDYVEDTAAPIAVEDGPINGVPNKVLDFSPSLANGVVTVTPNLAGGYACGEVVTLEAIPDPGYLFSGWTGDLSGSTNPTTLGMGSDRTVGAVFVLDNAAPVITQVQSAPGSFDAVITWTTDVAADSVVEYGLDNSYGNQESDGSLTTAHQVTLTGLAADTTYHFRVISTTANSGSAQSGDATFQTLPAPAGVIASDDFNGCGGLGSQWTFVDSPNLDGTFAVVGAGTGDAQLTIGVPGGVERQNFNTLGSPRVMQPVADEDFVVDLKFESEVSQPFQIQGLLVQQDLNNWIRFDVYSNSDGVHWYAGSTVSGVTHFKGDGLLAQAAPYYLRISRSSAQWEYSISPDGVTYSLLKSFNRPIVVSELGPYAGNAFSGGVSPAFTTEVDYVFDSANPIVPEDGNNSGGGPFFLTTSVPGGGGSVTENPDLSDYDCGDTVTLTAVPAAGFLFSGWGGDASGLTNPLPITMVSNTDIVANFTADNGAPIITNVAVTPQATGATITWDTVDPADSMVAYGTTAALGSNAGSAAQVTQHSVVLTGLNPLTTYFYEVSSTDGDGDTTTEAVASFSTLPSGSIVADDFNETNLNRGLWTFTDPGGVARLRMTGSGSPDARVEIEIPQGTVYEPFPSNNSAHLSQPVNDEDFTIQAKFENSMDTRYTSTGLFAESDVNNWIRLDYYFDGTNLNVFSARFTNGNPGSMQQLTVQPGAWTDDSPLYLRIARVGNNWTTSYSLDGTAWTQVKNFGSTIVPVRVGVFCGNSSLNADPHTVVVDWFESLSAPILVEDPGAGIDTTEPFIYDVDAVALSENAIQISWATDEPSTGQVQWGTTASYGQAPAVSSVSAYLHTVTLVGLASDTLYHFQVEASDTGANAASTADQTVRTQEPPVGNAPDVEFWYGVPDVLTGSQSLTFGGLGNAQSQFNVMGRVVDPDQDRIALEVTLEYRLNGRPWKTAALGDDRNFDYEPWRLANEGDFNIEVFVSELLTAPLTNGSHRSTLEMRVADNANNVVTKTAIIDYVPDVTWQGNLTLDWSQIAAANTPVENVVQIVDGKWEIFDDPTLGHVLRPDPNELGYDRIVAIGEGEGADGWDNYEVLLPVTVNALDPEGYTTGTSSYAMGFLMRWTGHTLDGPYPQPYHGLYPMGALWIFRWFNSNERWELWIDENEAILPQAGNDISVGVTYWYRLRCEDAPGGGTHYAFKVWADGQAEPSAWTFEHTTNPGDPPKGSFLLVAHHADTSFGDVVITQLP